MITINKKIIRFIDEKSNFHRLNGPSVFYSDYYQAWWKNGDLHRLDGPAVIDGDTQAWYINDEEYTENQFYDKLKEMGLR